MDPSILNFYQNNPNALPTQNSLKQSILDDYSNAQLQMPQVGSGQNGGQVSPLSLFQPQMVGQGTGANTNYLQSPQSYGFKQNMLLNNMLDAVNQGYYGANRFVNQVPPPPIPSQQQLQSMMNNAVQSYNQSQGGANSGRGGNGGYSPLQIPKEFDARYLNSDEWDADIARALGMTKTDFTNGGKGFQHAMRNAYLRGDESWFEQKDDSLRDPYINSGYSGGSGQNGSSQGYLAPPQLPQNQPAPRVSYSGGQPPQLPSNMQGANPTGTTSSLPGTKPYQATWQQNQQAWTDWLNNQANGTQSGMPNDLWSWFNSAGVYTPPVRGYDPTKPRTYWYEDYLGNQDDKEGGDE